MLEKYVNTSLASPGDGSAASPFNTFPGTTGGPAQSADTVWHIQAGPVCTLPVSLNATLYPNVTLRAWYGYGGASNFTEVSLPGAEPGTTVSQRVNDGCFEVNTSSSASVSPFSVTGFTGSDYTIDGLYISGASPAAANRALMRVSGNASAGNDGDTNRRLKITRCRFFPGDHSGIQTTWRDVELTFTQIRNVLRDGILLASDLTNSSRTGSHDVIAFCEFYEAGTVDPGDPAQLGLSDGANDGHLTFFGNYVYKSTTAKQGLLAGGGGMIDVGYNLFTGGGSNQVAVSTLRGTARMRGNVFFNTSGLQSRILIGANAIAPYLDAMAEGSSWVIEDNLWMGTNPGAIRLQAPIKGSVIIRRNTAIGSFVNGGVGSFLRAMTGTAAGAGASFSFLAEDNVVMATSDQNVAWDFGTSNIVDDRWVFRRNRTLTGQRWRQAGTIYDTPEAFALAQGRCTDEQAISLAQAALDSVGRPSPTSVLYTGTLDVGDWRLNVGKQVRNRPGNAGAW